MDLEDTMLSEISQKQKEQYYMISATWEIFLKMFNSLETGSRMIWDVREMGRCWSKEE